MSFESFTIIYQLIFIIASQFVAAIIIQLFDFGSIFSLDIQRTILLFQNEEAYMNGYNWEAFLNLYLQTNQPELLDGLDTDSEAGTYVALYDKADSDKADKLVGVINGLVTNPDKIYSFLKQNGANIEWD